MHPNDADQQHDHPIFKTVDGKLISVNGWWHCHCGLWNRPTSVKCAASGCGQARGETTCPKCGERFHPKMSN